MTPSVPFFRYDGVLALHRREYLDTVGRVLERGAFVLQEENRQFESALAAFTGASHAIGVANGTDALLLALRAAAVAPGEEVVLPSHTYVATAAAVHFVGATPVLVECGPDHLIDPAAIEAAVTPRTRAVIPVQLNGRTADMHRIAKIARLHDLMVVEDAAQAVGARFDGQSAGTFGVAGTYSFYPAKILGCFGDGGAVVTSNEEVAERVRLLRDHGRNDEGDVVSWGLNSRLDNLQAAILSVRLAHLSDEIDRRRQVAAMYQERLGNVAELILPPPPDAEGLHHDVYQNYEIEAEQRDELRAYLLEHRVGTIIQWGGTPVHQMKALGFDFHLPRTDELFRRCLLLPMHSMLTDAEVDYVASSVRAFYGA